MVWLQFLSAWLSSCQLSRNWLLALQIHHSRIISFVVIPILSCNKMQLRKALTQVLFKLLIWLCCIIAAATSSTTDYYRSLYYLIYDYLIFLLFNHIRFLETAGTSPCSFLAIVSFLGQRESD